MIRDLVEIRLLVSALLTVGAGMLLLRRLPFREHNAVLQLILLNQPFIFAGIKYSYLAVLFTTPFIGCSILFSLVYIFMVRQQRTHAQNRLPLYPEPAGRNELFLVIGELHHPRQPLPAEHPQWLTIPERGLFTGIAIFGAIGSDKTTGGTQRC